MKHIFILNPAAGNGKVSKEIHPKIIEACKKLEIDYEIHRTVSLGDARNFTKNRCADSKGSKIRFYSCGGDGTLNEVLNGLIGTKNAELAVIPSGTGNDFVRNFGDWKIFRDVEAQINGVPKKIDALEYELLDLSHEEIKEYEENSIKTKGYALNMFNLGFDAQAVAKAAQFKRRPFMSGTMSYIAGVLSVLVKLKTIEIDIEFSENEKISGNFLLLGIANGRFSGGGFDGSPQAKINDGLMDITLINRVTRRFFLSVVKNYHDGKHPDMPELANIYSHYQRKSAIFRPKEKVVLAIDGETLEVGAMKFGVVDNSVNMVIPEGIEFDQD